MRLKSVFFCLVLVCLPALAGDTLRFKLTGGAAAWTGMPVAASLAGLRPGAGNEQIVLERIENGQRSRIACQVEPGPRAQLWFIPGEPLEPGQTAVFEAGYGPAQAAAPSIRVERNNESFTLLSGENPILSYYHALHDVPAGVDPIFKRSGFIHPLWSPGGATLTTIQPRDHYHHYGIWNPWTKSVVEGREVDFWNLAAKQGTVRFAGLLAAEAGPVYGRLAIKQNHVAFTAGGGEQVAINEVWELRASETRLDGRPAWVIDLTSTLHNNLDSVIELPSYRYGGGLGFRATEEWTQKNCAVLTSEGKTRDQADGSRARWCTLSGTTAKGPGGILFMSHTSNFSHPEPMRVWPSAINDNRGDMFFEFCPIRIDGWRLEPNRVAVLSYRLIVFDGALDAATAETLWQNYANPLPILTVSE